MVIARVESLILNKGLKDALKRAELYSKAGADAIFEKVKFGKIKIKISKEYSLIDANKAHEDLEARKLTGPAILIP